MQVIVLADGEVTSRAALDSAWPGWLQAGARVVAADGGARHATGLGLSVERWVGDGDSIDEATLADLAARGVRIERAATDKDESDTELALFAAIELAPESIVVLGALGGPRLDHALANLALLSLPELDGVAVTLLQAGDGASPPSEPVRLALAGHAGDLVTLLPVGGDVLGVSTEGLRYPLSDEVLLLGRSRGLSNVRVAPVAAVSIRTGRLLVIETPATL
jgi:thiamine pyrophosphokinase